MEPLTAALLAALMAAAAIVFWRTLKSVVVYEFQAGLKFKKGKLVKTLEAGKHWYFSPSSRVQIVDLRPRYVTVPGQEVLTSDHITLRISLAAQYRVTQPRVAWTEVENYVQALYLQLQLALRQIVCTQPVDQVLALRGDFGTRLRELCAEPAKTLGLELISAEVKDIMFPGSLKQVFSQVVRARNEGLAALEKARGETAALRNLANAARLVEKNPTLMQLRLLHSLGETKGGKLIVNLGAETLQGGTAAQDESSEDDA